MSFHRLRQLRHLKAFAVLALDVFVGVVIFEAFGFWIKFQGSTQAIGDITEMAVDARELTIERGHRHVSRLARAHRCEEPLKLAPLFRLGGVRRNGNWLALAYLAFLVSEKTFA